MSHFVVTVVLPEYTEEALQKALQPFHEYECTGIVDEHVVWMDYSEEVHTGWNDPEENHKNNYTSIEEFASDRYGYEEKAGQYGSYTNPNSKWDWWIVGGRWSGLFKPKFTNDEHSNIKDVMGYEKGEKSWAGTSVSEDGLDIIRKRDVDFDSVDGYLFTGSGEWDTPQYEVIETGGKYYIPVMDFHKQENGDYTDAYIESLGREISEAEAKGAVQCLWDTFGGHITDQGYKVLHDKVGLIYGDSITLERAKRIFERLEAKGFASTNCVLGVGSYTSNYITRDSLGMAVKATWAQVNGEGYDLFKDPVTDDGTKKSAKGLLQVTQDSEGYFILKDQCTRAEEEEGLLEEVFIDGKIVKETSLSEIRNRLWSN